jgi:hypothetical protein
MDEEMVKEKTKDDIFCHIFISKTPREENMLDIVTNSSQQNL